MTSGEKIYALIKKKNLNMHKLAELSGVSYSTIYAIVKRNSENISSAVAIKLANALEVPISDIINFTDYQPDEAYIKAMLQDQLEYDAFLDYLQTKEAENIPISGDEGYPVELVSIFDQLNSRGQKKVIAYAKDLSGNKDYQNNQ